MDYALLYDKIYACWLGKRIGGALGAPAQSESEVLDPADYSVSDTPDLTGQAMQLLNLHVLETYGTGLTAEQIADEWSEHCFSPRNEYGHATTALRLGFKPPYAGMFDNHFVDCMGAAIRAEIWAVVAAGNPRMAACLARQDALVDHAGGEGLYAAAFIAALEAAAFELTDLPILIREALTCIPADSRVHGAVSLLLERYEQGADLTDAREAVTSAYGKINLADAPQNIAFTLAGLLWGKDLEDAILKTVSLGRATAATAATCGALWGILYGREGIPEKLVTLAGTALSVSDEIRGFRIPADLDELTRRCISLNAKLAYEDTEAYIAVRQDEDMTVQRFTLPAGAKPSEAFCVDIRYEDDDPTVAPERPQTLKITLTNNTDWLWTIEARMECPYGLAPDVPAQILIAPGESVLYCPTVKADTNAYYSVPVDRVYPAVLAIKRLNCGDRWKIYRLPITLLAPNRWTLNGKTTLVAGSTVSFTQPSADGVYVAEATLCTPPVTRETRMICNCIWPTTVELDGDVIIQTEGRSTFLPAYHRVPENQHRDGILQRGFHRLKVTVRIPEEARGALPTFVVSFNATARVTEPGNYYAYTDVHFAR